MPATDLAANAPRSLRVTSTAFTSGQGIPREHTCQGRDVSPPLAVLGLPREAVAFALTMLDPDAPGGTFTHWLAWDIPVTHARLNAGADLAALGVPEGANDFDREGYGGPCPPSGTHRYFFRVYAQRELLRLPPGATRDEVETALAGKVLAWGELMGTYARSAEARAPK